MLSAQTSSDPASESSESSDGEVPERLDLGRDRRRLPERDPVPRGRGSADHVGADHLGVRTHRLQHAEVPGDVAELPMGRNAAPIPGIRIRDHGLDGVARSSVGTDGRCLEVRVAVDDTRLALASPASPLHRLGPGA